ncbi:hypothetical protein [Mycolicibacterium goodii]|uniref:hypothetical protein n=1 Tax=Mycolicibacterium goodii TaxID=134601 RepID=UPI001BDD8CB6|nr:hypothetical protein [Mycolicibacterium goodii]MBU8831023.1 hypothetical protein [Mycolicibacterium goodii]
MAEVTDPRGTQWSVYRRWWPFASATDVIENAIFDTLGFLLIAVFVLAWPFWLMTKFLGARWAIRIDRDGAHVDTELVRGWSRSRRRITELAEQLGAGWRSGQYTV